MPHYRITVLLRDNKIVQGIRFFDNYNIDAVANIVMIKARHHFGEQNVYDVEAAQLSDNCTAVKNYLEKLQKARENCVVRMCTGRGID